DDANVFGKNGSGVFYGFIEDFEEEYGLNINPITFRNGTNPSGITLGAKTSVGNNDVVFFTDHYALIGTNNEIISDTDDLIGRTIGILTSDLSYVSTYINSTNVTFTQYESSEELFNAIGTDVTYAIVPLTYYLDTILSNNYNILYH